MGIAVAFGDVDGRRRRECPDAVVRHGGDANSKSVRDELEIGPAFADPQRVWYNP